MSQKLAKKVLVYAINEALRRGVFTLKPGPVNCPEPGFSFDMGGTPAAVFCHDAGYDEVRVLVTLWPTEEGREEAHTLNWGDQRWRGGFVTSGCLECRAGQWLMDGPGCYCSKPRLAEVKAMPFPQPNGFAASGKIII
jgi:hypothetical protein